MNDARSLTSLCDSFATKHPPEQWERVIAALAERQHGVLATRQLLAAGLTHSAIRRRVRRGRLVRLHHGVYSVWGSRPTQRGRWAAAVLYGGALAMLSHHVAAALWALASARSGPTDVTAPSKHASIATVRFHRSNPPPDERAVGDGLPLTSPARTILDLAPLSSDRAVERMIDEAEARRLGVGASLPALLERYPRRPGAPRIRRVLAARGALGLTRSELEERFLALLRRRGLREPRLNAPVRVAGHPYELDCFWPDLRLAVELDGYRFHAGRSSFRDDRIRDRRLRSVGIETVRVSAHDLGPGAAELEADLLAIRPGLAG